MLCRLSTTSKELPRAASPEEVGVSSALTEQFLHYIKEQNLEFHSFMAVSYTHLVYEGLKRINSGSRQGLEALKNAAGVSGKKLLINEHGRG